MMTNVKYNGGAAFPVPDSPAHFPTTGMSLRDYFAARAMQTLCGVPISDWPISALGHDSSVSAMAYEIADAMLAERSKQ
jgi:hypothetical protein